MSFFTAYYTTLYCGHTSGSLMFLSAISDLILQSAILYFISQSYHDLLVLIV